jgi:hypothetical protein
MTPLNELYSSLVQDVTDSGDASPLISGTGTAQTVAEVKKGRFSVIETSPLALSSNKTPVIESLKLPLPELEPFNPLPAEGTGSATKEDKKSRFEISSSGDEFAGISTTADGKQTSKKECIHCLPWSCCVSRCRFSELACIDLRE